MSAISKWAIGLALLAGAAYGQVPSTNDTSDGHGNTGMGTDALGGPNPVALTGTGNTASGFAALASNTGGTDNTALGGDALRANTAGNDNTASGTFALGSNTSGSNNTASGVSALFSNQTGSDNTAFGANALQASTSATGGNTATGANALYQNASGYYNTASGYQALFSNESGVYNTASGANSLYSNQTGTQNTATGEDALYSTTGSSNIAVGFQAGSNVTTGSNNIEIGHPGAAHDSGVIRIGEGGLQKKTFVAGIYGNTTVSGLAVVIGSNGELGAVSSSERFKTAVAPMGSNTEQLQQLRPVTFRYKTDPQDTVRYGLIAEEVARVYPELVVRDNKGRIDGVRYDELAPMLLNEVQKQAAEIRDLKRDEQQKLAAQDAEIIQLKQQMAAIRAALLTQPNKEQLVAQR
ncbi:MAG: tail fiber domain-containing protein [Steroidobacteraceae bacterium]|jgi:hypothetical protein